MTCRPQTSGISITAPFGRKSYRTRAGLSRFGTPPTRTSTSGRTRTPIALSRSGPPTFGRSETPSVCLLISSMITSWSSECRHRDFRWHGFRSAPRTALGPERPFGSGVTRIRSIILVMHRANPNRGPKLRELPAQLGPFHRDPRAARLDENVPPQAAPFLGATIFRERGIREAEVTPFMPVWSPVGGQSAAPVAVHFLTKACGLPWPGLTDSATRLPGNILTSSSLSS